MAHSPPHPAPLALSPKPLRISKQEAEASQPCLIHNPALPREPSDHQRKEPPISTFHPKGLGRSRARRGAAGMPWRLDSAASPTVATPPASGRGWRLLNWAPQRLGTAAPHEGSGVAQCSRTGRVRPFLGTVGAARSRGDGQHRQELKHSWAKTFPPACRACVVLGHSELGVHGAEEDPRASPPRTLAPWGAAPPLGTREPHQLATDCPPPGGQPQSPRLPGVALRPAGVSLVAARPRGRPRACSRTSCGGSWWRRRGAAGSAGECRARLLLPRGLQTTSGSSGGREPGVGT